MPLSAHPAEQPSPLSFDPRVHSVPERAARPEHPAHRVQGGHSFVEGGDGGAVATR